MSSSNIPDTLPTDPEFVRLLSFKGMLAGAIDLVDCKNMSPEDSEASFHDFDQKYYSWFMKNPRIFANPVACKGSLGLFIPKLSDGEHQQLVKNF